ncbi:hypothetical protein L6164_031377 [Bauhinia variegata]|uniref:Uncharacterized protein n=1 Tax=Bauhinia variegata TaxID=167791 RepID=A0ACB9LFK3_BAUVA|nr:hypothetical protein L6164_031377 [Bauhinia variegata]
MASTSEDENSSSLEINQHSPYYINPSDQPATPLVTQLLDGPNFPTWHQGIAKALEAKNKLGFINCNITKPDQTNPLYPYWVRGNKILKANERDRPMEFLHGLHSIRSQILLQDPLPSVNKASSILLQEERQRGLYQPSITADTAAMAAQKFYQKGGKNPGSSTRPYCTHCGKSGHYESKCYKKHGYPPRNLSKGDPQSGTNARVTPPQENSAAANNGAVVPLNVEQLTHCCRRP